MGKKQEGGAVLRDSSERSDAIGEKRLAVRRIYSAAMLMVG